DHHRHPTSSPTTPRPRFAYLLSNSGSSALTRRTCWRRCASSTRSSWSGRASAPAWRPSLPLIRTGCRHAWTPAGSAVTAGGWTPGGGPPRRPSGPALGADYARDGVALRRAVWDPASPSWLAQLPAVGVLQRVLIQNVVVEVDRGGREVIRLREADTDGLPPGRCSVISPYDTDAR